MSRRALAGPRILGLRPGALLDLYRWRVSDHKAQELLAGAGIAIGVALLFGVLVANSSLIGSTGQLIKGVSGAAQLQLAARSSQGFSETVAQQVGDLPGVKVAAPLLRENVQIVGPKGRDSVQLIGLTAKQVALKGEATRQLGAGALLLHGGVGLPAGVAEAVGAQPGQQVTVLANGEAHPTRVRAVLGSQAVGPIASNPVAVSLLEFAQQLTGKPGRVSEVLVQPLPGATRVVERGLLQLAAGRLNVEPATHELPVLEATATPTSQSTSLFAAVSATVGFLLALNAMLLTVPERRRFMAELRQQGFAPRQVLLILISQAVLLGLAASIVGVLLGDLLSRSLFQQVPSYLTFAFPIGTHPVVPLTTVALSLGCGVLATVTASLLPMVDLRRGRPADAVLRESGEAGQRISRRTTIRFGLVGVGLTAVVSIIVLLAPGLSAVGGAVLALAAFCLVPPIFVLAINLLRPLTERMRGSMLALAVVELDATATRSVALAGIAALAVYGMVAVQGARHDLIAGLDSAVVQYLDTADIWVTTNDNFLTIDSFNANGATQAIARTPGVASVREYQGDLLDVGTRRLWIRARPAGDSALIQASQMLHGELAQATRRLRAGGWAVLSNGFAEEHRLRIGDTFALPTPSGLAPLRVAAITTNVGWPPGAITLNAVDYRRYWQTTKPTALEVKLKPDTPPAAAQRAIRQTLAAWPGLLVETAAQRKASFEASARQGIKSLTEIATLLLIATSLAIAAALSAAIFQRRARLASLKCDGFDGGQLWRSLLLESAILICIGCLDGAILGVYGHALASRWLKHTVGFPAPFSLGLGLVFLTLTIITCVSLAVIAVPGRAAARVPARASFQE